jgi:hypothetical protein
MRRWSCDAVFGPARTVRLRYSDTFAFDWDPVRDAYRSPYCGGTAYSIGADLPAVGGETLRCSGSSSMTPQRVLDLDSDIPVTFPKTSS